MVDKELVAGADQLHGGQALAGACRQIRVGGVLGAQRSPVGLECAGLCGSAAVRGCHASGRVVDPLPLAFGGGALLVEVVRAALHRDVAGAELGEQQEERAAVGHGLALAALASAGLRGGAFLVGRLAGFAAGFLTALAAVALDAFPGAAFLVGASALAAA